MLSKMEIVRSARHTRTLIDHLYHNLIFIIWWIGSCIIMKENEDLKSFMTVLNFHLHYNFWTLLTVIFSSDYVDDRFGTLDTSISYSPALHMNTFHNWSRGTERRVIITTLHTMSSNFIVAYLRQDVCCIMSFYMTHTPISKRKRAI